MVDIVVMTEMVEIVELVELLELEELVELLWLYSAHTHMVEKLDSWYRS